jgi:oxygen-independent coproporphyrinogen-3 oxidase
LGRWTVRGEVTPVAEECYATEFLAAHQALGQHEYEHYEVSNAARPGHRARHNSAYWRRAHFIGLGPAAHSGFQGERRWNVREWAAYERLVGAGQSPMEGRELLNQAAISLEELYLGLRTTEGLTADRIPSELRREWQARGWAADIPERVQLTPEGWLRLDALVASVDG